MIISTAAVPLVVEGEDGKTPNNTIPPMTPPAMPPSIIVEKSIQ
jgi:hypothetical protein